MAENKALNKALDKDLRIIRLILRKIDELSDTGKEYLKMLLRDQGFID